MCLFCTLLNENLNMPDETVKFVQLVKKYPCLYNNTLPEYTQKDVTEKAWTEIAHQMKWNVVDCKEKWRNMRNAYLRSLKPHPNGSPKAKRPYYLSEVMEFVRPYVTPFQRSENIGTSTGTGNTIIKCSEKNGTGTTAIIKAPENIGTGTVIIQSPEHIVSGTCTSTAIIKSPESDLYACNELNTIVESTQFKNVDVATAAVEVLHKRTQDMPHVIEEKKMKPSLDDSDKMDQTVLQYIQVKKDKNKTPIDSRKMFLLSLLPDVMKLSDVHLRQFKIRTMLLLEDLLNEQEEEIANGNFCQPLPTQCSSFQFSTPAPSPTDFNNGTQCKGKICYN